MIKTLKEILAALTTISVLFALPWTILQYGPWNDNGDCRVIHLTGTMKHGIWTDEEVNGSNYWWKSFKPANIKLIKGEEVLLRLSSMDVTHNFYLPELNIGPIEVKSGYTEEIVVKPNRTGTFTYYCITVCGDCHYFMRGIVTVFDENNKAEIPENNLMVCSLDLYDEKPISFVEKGKHLYKSLGCVSCHGVDGIGQVYNPNYVREFVPELNNLADKMKIYWKEDAETVVQLFETGADIEHLERDQQIDNYRRFLAQYHSIQNKIINGSPTVQKLDPNGPEPPLKMPAWEEKLSKEDINSILAYLITQYPWEEYE